MFTDPKERAKAIGIWAGVSALGLGFGPITGGFLLAHFWWGSIFLVNVPIVIVGLFLGYRYVPESKDPAPSKADPRGALLSIAALGVLLAADAREFDAIESQFHLAFAHGIGSAVGAP